MIVEINKAWGWKGFIATEVVRTNDFGNVIVKTDQDEYWRICPEEISCEKIANLESELDRLLHDPEFMVDWEMANLVEMARAEVGELGKQEKYCLKIPAVLGGRYEKENLGKISFAELILFSGDIGFQIKDLKDGQQIKLRVKE